MRQAQKLETIGQLTAGIAHDFNNLLMSIGANAEFIVRRHRADQEQAKRLASIMSATERGGRLTGQLLAFARKQTLRPQDVLLNQVLQDMDSLITSSLGGNIKIEFDLAPDLWITFIDPDQTTQVVLNLVINAKDAMPSGGSLTIHTENVAREASHRPSELGPGEYVLLAVSDTGAGMSDEVLSHAFDPFFTTKQIGEGSGLGLSQVHGIVQQSGGTTTIQSRIGKGTTVSIYLPRVGLADHSQHSVPRHRCYRTR